MSAARNAACTVDMLVAEPAWTTMKQWQEMLADKMVGNVCRWWATWQALTCCSKYANITSIVHCISLPCCACMPAGRRVREVLSEATQPVHKSNGAAAGQQGGSYRVAAATRDGSDEVWEADAVVFAVGVQAMQVIAFGWNTRQVSQVMALHCCMLLSNVVCGCGISVKQPCHVRLANSKSLNHIDTSMNARPSTGHCARVPGASCLARHACSQQLEHRGCAGCAAVAGQESGLTDSLQCCGR